MNKPKIYADFNAALPTERDDESYVIPLTTYGSLRELSNLGLCLRDGLELIVYMDSDENEDIEADAVVRYSTKYKCWLAVIHGEIRDVPITNNEFSTFCCSKCKYELYPIIKNGLNIGDTCPKCNTPIHSVIAPPEVTK